MQSQNSYVWFPRPSKGVKFQLSGLFLVFFLGPKFHTLSGIQELLYLWHLFVSNCRELTYPTSRKGKSWPQKCLFCWGHVSSLGVLVKILIQKPNSYRIAGVQNWHQKSTKLGWDTIWDTIATVTRRPKCPLAREMWCFFFPTSWRLMFGTAVMYQHYTFKGEVSEIFMACTRRFWKENPGIQNMGFGQGGSTQIPSRHFRAAQLCVPLQQNLTGRHGRSEAIWR